MMLAAREHLNGFLDALRVYGISVQALRRVDFLRAVTLTRLHSIDDLYWAARITLLSTIEQVEPFERAFDAWFRSGRVIETLLIDDQGDDESETERPDAGSEKASSTIDLGEGTGREATRDDLWNRRKLPGAAEDERSLWAKTVRTARSTIPRTGGRRLVPHQRKGIIDLRRVLSDSMGTGGEVLHQRYRRRPQRMRRVLLLIDVSGSLKPNSTDFLRFAHAVMQGAEQVEVFTFGTRLTRISRVLRNPNLDEALGSLESVIHDFDGGTRIGDAFDALLSDSRYVSFARGAVIIVLSDGLERGDPGLMAETTSRLARLGHRLIWLTPMMSDPAYSPATRGMRAILGSLDRLGDASSAATLVSELWNLHHVERRPRQRAAAAWRNERRTA